MSAHLTLTHPLVREALLAHGLTTNEVESSDLWRAQQIYSHYIDAQGRRAGGLASDGRALELCRTFAKVTLPQGAFELQRTRTGWDSWMQLWRITIPETVAAGLPGRPLSDLVDLPGAAEIRILGVRGRQIQLEAPA